MIIDNKTTTELRNGKKLTTMAELIEDNIREGEITNLVIEKMS